MPSAAYDIARRVAARIAREHSLTPPFDVERLAARWVRVAEDDLPGGRDVFVTHGRSAEDRPWLLLGPGVSEIDHLRRVAVAHGLAHALLAWHPLGAPCTLADRPPEQPMDEHALVEGEAHAFARELLAPQAWITSFNATDTPAVLMRHVAERAGISLMPAARAVSMLLEPHVVWVALDDWSRVLDAGRSPGTDVVPPSIGEELDVRAYARAAARRFREQLGGVTVHVWAFDPRELEHVRDLPRDARPAHLTATIADDLGWPDDAARQLHARLDGIAGWANTQAVSTDLAAMHALLAGRAHDVLDDAAVLKHPAFSQLLDTKARELVAPPLAVAAMSHDVFETTIGAALAELPEHLARHVENVEVLVDDAWAEDPDLYGLYVGTPLTERGSGWDSPMEPDRIYVFREPLLADFGHDPATLAREIRITVLHELGHYFGLDEARLSALGWS